MAYTLPMTTALWEGAVIRAAAVPNWSDHCRWLWWQATRFNDTGSDISANYSYNRPFLGPSLKTERDRTRWESKAGVSLQFPPEQTTFRYYSIKKGQRAWLVWLLWASWGKVVHWTHASRPLGLQLKGNLGTQPAYTIGPITANADPFLSSLRTFSIHLVLIIFNVPSRSYASLRYLNALNDWALLDNVHASLRISRIVLSDRSLLLPQLILGPMATSKWRPPFLSIPKCGAPWQCMTFNPCAGGQVAASTFQCL